MIVDLISEINPIEYNIALKNMLDTVEKIKAGKARPLLWLLEHKAICTTGTSFVDSHIKEALDIAIIKSTRGGSVTIHSPGQRIAYIMVPLKKLQIDIVTFITKLESVIISVLKKFNIFGYRMPKERGIWVNGKKIGFIGIRISKGITYHGLAINAYNDLSLYSKIMPCGLTCDVTSIIQEKPSATISKLDRIIEKEMASHLDLQYSKI